MLSAKLDEMKSATFSATDLNEDAALACSALRFTCKVKLKRLTGRKTVSSETCPEVGPHINETSPPLSVNDDFVETLNDRTAVRSTLPATDESKCSLEVFGMSEQTCSGSASSCGDSATSDIEEDPRALLKPCSVKLERFIGPLDNEDTDFELEEDNEELSTKELRVVSLERQRADITEVPVSDDLRPARRVFRGPYYRNSSSTQYIPMLCSEEYEPEKELTASSVVTESRELFDPTIVTIKSLECPHMHIDFLMPTIDIKMDVEDDMCHLKCAELQESEKTAQSLDSADPQVELGIVRVNTEEIVEKTTQPLDNVNPKMELRTDSPGVGQIVENALRPLDSIEPELSLRVHTVDTEETVVDDCWSVREETSSDEKSSECAETCTVHIYHLFSL